MSFPSSSNLMLREKGPDWKLVLTNTLKVLCDFGYMLDLVEEIKLLRV